MNLRLISQTATKMTIGWDPVPGATAGYRGREIGAPKWTQTQQMQMVFRKGAEVEVEALGIMDRGKYPAPEPPPPPPVEDKLGAFYKRYGNGELPTSHLTDYDIIVTSYGGAPAAGASAGKKVLVYMSQLSCKPGTGWHYGVTLEDARANGWILKDSSGNELVNVAFSDSKVGDPGSAGYQQKWASNVAGLLSGWGSDGVFVDDVLWWVTNMTRGPIPQKYQTQGAWLNAVVSFFAYVGPYLKQRGFYVAANASGWYPGSTNWDLGGVDDLALWKAVGPHVDALNCEYYQWHESGVSRSSGSGWNQRWDEWQRLPAYCEQSGIDFLGMCDSAVATQGDYSTLSALLETNGSVKSGVDSTNPWRPIHDRLKTLGEPTAAKVKSGNRWQRQYQGGLVWVDPVAVTSGIS